MVALAPHFWSTPVRYLRWASRERPNYFWPIAVGCTTPLMFVVGPPLRKLFGDENPPAIPMTYPVPTGPRKQVTGYDDDANDK